MCHPAILESGTRMGEHGVRLKPDGLKQSIYELEHSICDSKHSFWQPDDSNTLFYNFYDDGRKMVSYALGEHNVGQLKMGEHQAKCRTLKSSIFKLDIVNCKCRSTFAQSVVTSFQRSSPSQISPRLAQDH